MILQGAFLVGEILLLPYQAYELWFDLFQSGMERGRVSHLFVKLGTLLTVIICWIYNRQDHPLAGLKQLFYLPLFFLFILRPTFGTGFLFLSALLGSRIRRDNYRNILLLMLFALSFGLTGIKSPAKGARFIDNRSDRFITFLTETWPSLPILYDIPLYGESFSHTLETGGRPTLTTHRILTVEGSPGERIYLRTETTLRRGDKGDPLPLEGLPPAAESPPVGLHRYRVKITTDFINMVPFTQDTALIERGEVLYEAGPSRKTLIPEPPLFQGDSFLLYTDPNRGDRETEDFDFSPYLAPDKTPSQRLIDLAGSLGGDSPGDTAEKIRAYLAENYTYTLDTREQENYTEYFLFESGEGYCLHFATAFAALARLNGIPCRFAQGYLVTFPDSEEYWEHMGYVPERITVAVTGLSSHMWPEVYLKNRGWVRYEATPPYYVPDSRTGEDRLTLRQLSEAKRVIEPAGEEPARSPLPPLAALLIPLPVVLILILRRLKDLFSRFGRNTLFAIRRYVRLAYAAGIDRPRETGWREWGRNVLGEMPHTAPYMKEILPLILKARYSPKSLGKGERELLREGAARFRRDSRNHRR
jgi:transglutaminase-like putative cysteine protease